MRKYLSRAESLAKKPLDRWLTPLGDFGVRAFRGFLLIALLVLLFGQLAEDVVSLEVGNFDLLVTNLIRQYTSLPLTTVMKTITSLDSPGVLTVIVILLVTVLFWRRRPLSEPVLLTAATTGSWLLNELLKWSFHRPRPDGNWLVQATGYSFPSGHSMVAIAFYGALTYLLWNWLPSAKLRWLSAALSALLVLSIGISRIYLGVHYPSDVLAGFAAGAVWLTVCVLAYEAAKQRMQSGLANRRSGWQR